MQLAIEYRRPPSALVYMARAFRRSPATRLAGGFPALRLAWRDVRPLGRDLAAFAALTGLEVGVVLPALVPHVIGFRLQMALLTHPAWPLPIWRALQVRNRLVQHRPLRVGEPFDLVTSAGARRVLERGLEVDLHSAATSGGATAWESTVTYYYRGSFGAPGTPSPWAQSPDAGADEVSRWHSGPAAGLRFGRLTGDYNGIHLWSPYARLFGFEGAFHHPQLMLGQCMARLPGPGAGAPQRLDAWLKGPVLHGSQVVLRGRCEADMTTFALFGAVQARPAIVGRWAAPDASPA